jgi:hypothetical protein
MWSVVRLDVDLVEAFSDSKSVKDPLRVVVTIRKASQGPQVFVIATRGLPAAKPDPKQARTNVSGLQLCSRS